MKYDNRMNLWENWVYGIYRPFLCWLKDHNITCYKIVPTEPQEWVHICKRCMIMLDKMESCGQCTNGCDTPGKT